ncbi:MAG: prolipoprotein diacylglyceryl transferase [Candidatus Planktophila sp.]
MHTSIPTPSISVVEIGPFTVHAYALCIITGVAVAIWLSNKRFVSAFPATRGVVSDVAIVAVPSGVLGGRLYHVITTPERFFGSHGHPENILKIWQGGLGIWGAITLGGIGAYLAYLWLGRTRELPKFRHFADAVAPGIIFAQAIGRWGNWFNAELFGKPTTLPWALEIPRWARPDGYQEFLTFHPTFLYESIWCVAVGFLLLRLGTRLKAGQIFALYVALYCLGRLGFELLRIDSAHLIAGIRINVLVSLAVGAISLALLPIFSRSAR